MALSLQEVRLKNFSDERKVGQPPYHEWEEDSWNENEILYEALGIFFKPFIEQSQKKKREIMMTVPPEPPIGPSERSSRKHHYKPHHFGQDPEEGHPKLTRVSISCINYRWRVWIKSNFLSLNNFLWQTGIKFCWWLYLPPKKITDKIESRGKAKWSHLIFLLVS